MRNLMKNIFIASLLILSALLSANTSAEIKKVFGDYEIHYIVLNSTFLEPKVAKAYNLKRSKNLGYVSISVLKNDKSTDLPAAVNADLSLVMSNLIGQKKTIELKRIEESGAIYYLNTFTFDNEDTYNFYLTATPENHKRTYNFRFSQKMYAEDFNQNK